MAEATFIPGRARPSWLARLRRRGFRSIPLLVWSGAIVAVVFLAQAQHTPMPFPAITQVIRYTVKAPGEARLIALNVEEQQLVQANQLVGSLDGADLQLRLERARAEVSRLQAQMRLQLLRLKNEELSVRANRGADLRRFRQDRENAYLDMLEVQADIEVDRIKLVWLRYEKNTTTTLQKDNAGPESDRIQAAADHDSLQERIRQNEIILRERKLKVTATEKRLTDYLKTYPPDSTPVDATAALSWSVKAQEVELEEIALLRTRLALRAPTSGRVESILARPNELLIAGQPLLTIIETEPRKIIAYIPESIMSRVQPGMKVAVETVGLSPVRVETSVTGIGLAVEPVPEHLLRDPRRAEFGRPVYLAMPANLKQRPGTALRVRLLSE